MVEYIENLDVPDPVVQRDLEEQLFRIFRQAREKGKCVTWSDIDNQLMGIHAYEHIKCMLAHLESKQYIVTQKITKEIIVIGVRVSDYGPPEILKPGCKFLEWSERMQKTEHAQIQQQINIGRDVNGPFHAGTGDIEVTLSEQDMTALIEIIRLLSSQQPASPDFVQKVQAALDCGKTGIDLLKTLIKLPFGG